MLSYKQLYTAMVNGTIQVKDNERYSFYRDEDKNKSENWIYGSELKEHQRFNERMWKQIKEILASGTFYTKEEKS